jgi:hypothetical protein
MKDINGADYQFSLYIRLRDTHQSGTVTCPNCKRKVFWKKAKVLRLVKCHTDLRYNEENAIASCSLCSTSIPFVIERLKTVFAKRKNNEVVSRVMQIASDTRRKKLTASDYIDYKNEFKRKKLELIESRFFGKEPTLF